MTRRRSYTSSHWGAYEVIVENGKVSGLKAFKDDPLPSDIGHNLPDVLESELRISQPMVREGWLKHGPRRKENNRGREPFIPVSWDQALELVAGEISRVSGTHGNQAIFGGSYGWASAGRFHHSQSQLHRFLNLAGGYTSSVNTYSSAAGEVIVPHVLGHSFYQAEFQATTWDVLADHCEVMLLIGGMAFKNSQVHPGGISRHTAPGWMEKCRARGCEFINVSPLRSDADRSLDADWLPLNPNTDTALMIGVAHSLYQAGLHDRAYLEKYCAGFDRFRDYLTGTTDGVVKDAAWAAEITGIEAGEIQTLARRLAGKRCFISLSLSVQRADHGEQTYWMAITLAAMLGQIGKPGGGVGFGNGALGGVSSPRFPFKGPTLPQGENPVDHFIPVARLTDMLLGPGEDFDYNGRRYQYPDTRLVYWCGGNPFHHQMDLNRLVRGWQMPETVIVNEIWWNALARHGDIILPATTSLERNDIGFAASDQNIFAMKQAVAPVGGARNDFDIFSGIADKMGLGQAFTEGLDEQGWLRRLYGEFQAGARAEGVMAPEFDEFWRQGYITLQGPEEAGRYAGKNYLGDFIAAPDQNPLGTPSGRIEIFSETIAGFHYADCAGHPRWYEPYEWLGQKDANSYPLHLLSNQPKSKLHSQLDHGKVSRADKIKGRAPARLNPDDAGRRNIRDGDVIRLFNDRGACFAAAVLSDDVRPGVVQLSTGAWFDPMYGNHPLGADRHGNPNILTRDQGTSRLAQGPTAHTTLVDAEWVGDAAPAVEIFTPPRIIGHKK